MVALGPATPSRFSTRRLAWWAALAIAGPFTGPLIAGLVRNWRRGERVLVALYAVAIPLVWFDLAGAARWLSTAYAFGFALMGA